MIEFDRVCVTYRGDVVGLQNVSIRIQRGEFAFIIGPTGAGKSTFLRLLYAAEKPSQGRVTVAGQDVSRLRSREVPRLRRRIGIVFQDYSLLPDKTVWENTAFALRVTGASRALVRNQVPRVLEMVGMAHRPDAFPHQLSGGEQQRVAIARAIVNDPPLLLADEPTGNLDPAASMGIVELLTHINGRGATVLVATHDAAIVDRMQRRVIAFSGGRLIRDEPRGLYEARACAAVGDVQAC